MDYLKKGSCYLIFMDLSASGITGSVFENCFFPNLKILLLDFCPKLKSLSLQKVPKMSFLSIYGTHFEQATNENVRVVSSSGQESEVEIQEFARKRGLRITNWEITRKSMVKGVPFMLSQVYLTSLADRE